MTHRIQDLSGDPVRSTFPSACSSSGTVAVVKAHLTKRTFYGACFFRILCPLVLDMHKSFISKYAKERVKMEDPDIQRLQALHICMHAMQDHSSTQKCSGACCPPSTAAAQAALMFRSFNSTCREAHANQEILF